MTVVFGAGAYCLPVIELIEACGDVVSAVIDDDPQAVVPRGLPLWGRNDFLEHWDRRQSVVVAVGDGASRRQIFNWLRSCSVVPSTYRHPDSYVSPSAELGLGAIIHKDAFVWSACSLGEGVIMSPGSRLAHHVTLGHFSLVSMGAIVGSGVCLGEQVLVGVGAVVMTGVSRVGSCATVGAGAVVIRDVPPNERVVGNPARTIGIRKA